jgi:D-alanine-D-alanine ligase
MTVPTRTAPDWLQSRLRRGEALSKEAGILLVVNVKGRTTPSDDYTGNSIITEFLSANELDDIMGYFEGAGFYCEVVLDEEGFIDWSAQKRAAFPRKYIFVYNLAQNGTGRGRLTTVAGLCRLHHLPLVDSDAYSVAISQHKFHAMCLLSQFGLPVAKCWSYSLQGWWPDTPPPGSRLIAKPTYESASIGVQNDSVFRMEPSAERQLRDRTLAYRQPFTVQQFVPGFEVEVPVFDADGPQTLVAIGIELNGQRNLGEGILTYDKVFRDEYGFYDFSDQDPASSEAATAIARRAFRALELRGIGRVDFRVTSTGEPLIIEVNCKPHVTKHSGFISALKVFSCSGMDLAKFLVGSAAERYQLTS